MKASEIIPWILVVAGALYLAIALVPIAPDFYLYMRSISFYAAVEGKPLGLLNHLYGLWMIFGRIVNALVPGLSAIALGLVLTRLYDFPADGLRQWSHWHVRDEGPSIGLIIAKTLKVGAILLMITLVIDSGYLLVKHLEDVVRFVMGTISTIVWALVTGLTAYVIGGVLEHVQRAAIMKADSPFEPRQT